MLFTEFKSVNLLRNLLLKFIYILNIISPLLLINVAIYSNVRPQSSNITYLILWSFIALTVSAILLFI